MMNSHHYIPPSLSVTPTNLVLSQGASQVLQATNKVGQVFHAQHRAGQILQPNTTMYKCPECNQSFPEVQTVFYHSAQSHYWNIMASLFISDFLMTNGKCVVCPKGQKIKSMNNYMKHMGGKHRLITKFMSQERINEYNKLPTTDRDYQDAQALLALADQPERHLMRKVREKERKYKSSEKVDRVPSQVPSTSYGQPAYPQMGFNPQTLNVSHFMTPGSPAFSIPSPDGGGGSPVDQKMTKKGRTRRTEPHDPVKCPECDSYFEHVSSLYIHSAAKHYQAQLSELFKNNFMKTEGRCSACPNRVLNDLQSYIMHVGAKHKMIHQFIPPDILREYEKLPAIRTKSNYTPVKNASLIDCIICGVNAKKKFGNLTEYKQHLAITHFRNQISNAYLNNYAHSATDVTCPICASRGIDAGRMFKSTYALITHLGATHNCVLDFADDNVRGQLQSFNVYKN